MLLNIVLLLREEMDQKKLEVHNLRLSAASLLQVESNDVVNTPPGAGAGGPITILQSRLKVAKV